MQQHTSYRTYWIAWFLLLVLTGIMLLAEKLRLPALATLVVLVGAMLVKATVIGGWFMHLRYERPALVLSVVLGTLATAAALFFLIVPDGISMYHLAE
jgi:cytochrome c oxidase subunit IV